MKYFRIITLAFIAILPQVNLFAQTANELIQKHMNAMGGEKKWKELKTIKMVGSMNQAGVSVAMTQTIVNGKAMRTDISAMDQNGFMIITQDSGWVFLPFMGQTTPEALPDEQIKMSKDKMNFSYSQLLDKEMIVSAALEGKDTIDGNACQKIVVKAKDGNTLECYIDLSNYYLKKMVTKINVLGGDQEVAVTYSDFKKQPGGMVVPAKWSTMQGEVTFSSIELNKTENKKIFRP